MQQNRHLLKRPHSSLQIRPVNSTWVDRSRIRLQRIIVKFGIAVGALLCGILVVTGGIYAATEQFSSETIVHTDSTIYSDDLTVEAGQIFEGDVIIYSGDVRVESEGVIRGALVVYSGDITLDTNAVIGGDVIGMSGDAEIAGDIAGDLVMWSGDIHLEDGAIIRGDVSVMSGEIHRSAEAAILGNIIAGPKLPQLPPLLQELGWDLSAQSTIVPNPPATNTGSWNRMSRLLLRMIGATFLTAFVVLFTGLIYYLQPTLVHHLRETLTTQKPTSFVIGLLLNIVLMLLIMVAFRSGSVIMTVCLAPVSLIAILLFLILNTGGWAALSLSVGERLLTYLKVEGHPLTALIVGATAMTGTIAFVWALGNFMRPVAFLVMLTLSALGGGALIIMQLQKRSKSESTAAS